MRVRNALTTTNSSIKKVSFCALGGGNEVGRSCYLLTFFVRKSKRRFRVVVDSGLGFTLENGEKARTLPNFQALDGEHVDLILVTHGHTDHVGTLLDLSHAHPEANIVMNETTADVAMQILNNTINIEAGELEESLKETHLAMRRAHLKDMGSRIRIVDGPGWEQPLEEFPEFRVYFHPSGHIRGAASIFIDTPGRRVVFSGDISFRDTHTVAGAVFPEDLPEQLRNFNPDVLVTESTYGNTSVDVDEETDRFVRKVKEVLARGGNVLIPAFAIGRSQDIALLLADAGIQVYLAGGLPMAMWKIFLRPSWNSGDGCVPPLHPNIRTVTRYAELRYRILPSEGGRVVVASAGMLDAGLSRKIAHAWLENPRNAILFTGYQAPGSGGRKLLALKRGEMMRFTERKKDVERTVLADVEQFSLSAHADGPELVRWIAGIKARQTLLVHGEPKSQHALRKALEKAGCKARCTENNTTYYK